MEQNKEIAHALMEELKGGTSLEDVLFLKESMIEETVEHMRFSGGSGRA